MRTFLILLVGAASFGAAAAKSAPPIFQTTVASGFVSPMPVAEANRPSRADTDLRRMLKSACRDNAFCLEFTGETTGTGFLFLEPDVLATSLHNMRGFLKSYWSKVDPNRLDNIRVPLVLRQSGMLIFGADGDVALINVSATAQHIVMSDQLEANPDQDVVYIRLSREIAQPLPQATEEPKGSIRAVGYVSGDLQIFAGKVVPWPYGKETFKTQFSDDGQQVVRFGTYYGAEKLSGSPVLNDRQEVVGIHTGEVNGGSADSVRYFRALGAGY